MTASYGDPSIRQGTIGYYRFTDIFFEWSVFHSQWHIGRLSIVIRVPAHIDGHTSTFENGEMRLLFSSAQVEYLRYYIHACALTDALIPLPASEYLIQKDEMRNCAPDVYNDAAVLKRAIKVRRRPALASAGLTAVPPRPPRPQSIEKNNKRLRNTSDLLAYRRLMFERVRTFWAGRLGTWLALDFEAWDRDHSVLTEFGWSRAWWPRDEHGNKDLEAGGPSLEHGHLVVREHQHYSQTYVPDHRKHYNFGTSEIVSRAEFKQRIRDLIAQNRADGPLFLVFHDNSQDIKYLQSDMVKAVERIEVLTDAPHSGELYIVDTADLFAALEGEAGGQTRSLERVCRLLQIQTEYLHNAGNDAHYTLDATIAMAAGEPVDAQRDRRWPGRTVDTQAKVQFQPWEEDSDADDIDDFFGFPRASDANMPPSPTSTPTPTCRRRVEAGVEADANAAPV
ncbi:uncharacterized protein BXZ73DRAFT_97505 [Epithele typhae]|uniref:uncharacterized protein n=1 Tax=Epithele typhae TaxID=378194 RepID=UPI00200814A0|nr:uncharacterized protein BXZ73DRAFT_97505 [Epithele typhae]KAH9943465.1 hypothetical protein BXZ73DRAFT_97505 [Epithele typhae]